MPTGAVPGRHQSRHLSSSSTSNSISSFISEKPRDGKGGFSTPRLAALTVSILGVQIFWSILMAHGTPYLHTLGFSSALTSLVWMAGPLGGVLIQPIVGVWSDRYRPKQGSLFEYWGRRKPFILLGSVGVAIMILCLANVREGFEFLGLISGISKHRIEAAIGQEGHGSPLLVAVAMFWVYMLNIAIQPVQAGVRAFVVDNVLPHQQADANAWLSRWNCFGAVFAFWLGSLDLPRIVPFLGRTQFKALSFVEVFVLLITVPISFAASSEIHEEPKDENEEQISVAEIWRSLYRTYKSLPRSTWAVFKIQFWAWMAWFPFLYYNTVYIGSLVPDTQSRLSSSYSAMVGHDPMSPPTGFPKKTVVPRSHWTPSMGSDPDELAAQTGSFASFLFALMSLVFTIVLPFLTHHVRFLTQERLWFAGHLIFAVVMLLTFFVETVAAGTALIACLGFSWAMTQWVPFALISAQISRVEATAREDRESGWASAADQQMAGAGAVFGLHNVAIAGPQVLAAVECAALFKLFEILDVQDAIGDVLRFAGVAALIAATFCRHMLK